jgi:hypothetical protein
MAPSLTEKFNLYRTLAKGHQDDFGFVYTDECDSLLWSSLLGCIPGMRVDLRAALRSPQGPFLRRPVTYPECYGCGGSKSTISRDMLLGVAWYCWINRDLKLADNVVRYALKHCLKMGDGDLTRIMISPALLATFAEIVHQLGGRNYWYLRWIPYTPSRDVRDYERHLACLHALLRRELGRETQQQRNVLFEYAVTQSHNPLYLIAGDCWEMAEETLIKDKVWPSNHLPTTLDYKDRWVVQRDYGDNWQPKHVLKYEHCGGDFLFCCWLLQRYRC